MKYEGKGIAYHYYPINKINANELVDYKNDEFKRKREFINPRKQVFDTNYSYPLIILP